MPPNSADIMVIHRKEIQATRGPLGGVVGWFFMYPASIPATNMQNKQQIIG